MADLFEIKDVDRRTYEDVDDFLPESIVDIHTHVWKDPVPEPSGPTQGPLVTWPNRVAQTNPVEDLIETYRLLLPGKSVTPLIFPIVWGQGGVDARNNYVKAVSARNRLPALLFALPEWSVEELERRVEDGGFLGIKVYLNTVGPGIPDEEIEIFDYLPPHQLEAANRNRWIVMLHIPRPGRLSDPVNLDQLMEIDGTYPRARVIVAHVGRAYCPEDVGNAFDRLSASRHLLFDITANTNGWVFEQLLRCVGPGRVLFGSDLPILRMRMRRICEGGRYVNLVPKGLYGDVSGDSHMREVEGEQAEALSFFLYEEILAFKRASESVGLSRRDVGDVFYGNGAALLGLS